MKTIFAIFDSKQNKAVLQTLAAKPLFLGDHNVRAGKTIGKIILGGFTK